MSSIVSVIIPCYNAAHFLPETLAYLEASEGVRLDIICVNDGSTDETAAVLEGFSQRVTVVHQKNAGLSAARNAGLAHVTGEFVHFHDADDRVAPTFYRSMLDEMARRPEIDVIVGHCRLISHEGQYIRDWLRVPHGDLEKDSFHTLLAGSLGPPIAFVSRATAIHHVKVFEQSILCEDWDFFLGMAKHGARFGLSHTCLSDYRVSYGSASSASTQMWQSAHYVIAKHENFHSSCAQCMIAAKKAKSDCDFSYAMSLINAIRQQPHNFGQMRHIWRDIYHHPSLIRYLLKAVSIRGINALRKN